MINFSVTKNGNPLDKSLYMWDEETKTFSSNEDHLVLDFTDVDGVTFITGSNCTFKTGAFCIFDTASDCIFNTGANCTFDTTYSCSFNVGTQCVLVRRDIYDIIPLPTNKILKLNDDEIKGFTLLDKTDS